MFTNKKNYFIAIILGLLVLLLLTLFVAIPRGAALTVPYKWRNIPLGYQRNILHQYLGNTTTPDTVYTATHRDEWIAYRNNGLYQLQVQYGTDSIATHYQLWFTYRLGFIRKKYLLKEAGQ